MTLNAWKARLQAAQAVLGSPQSAVQEKRLLKVLADTASVLDAAVLRLEESLSALQSAKQTADAERRRYAALFQDLPIAAITTDRFGDIIDLNPAAQTLLNTSERYASRKSLLLFFDDRLSWMDVLKQLHELDKPILRPVTVRPKERAPKRFRAHVGLSEGDVLRWFLLPASE
jgi:PAS domain-containing protein